MAIVMYYTLDLDNGWCAAHDTSYDFGMHPLVAGNIDHPFHMLGRGHAEDRDVIPRVNSGLAATVASELFGRGCLPGNGEGALGS